VEHDRIVTPPTAGGKRGTRRPSCQDPAGIIGLLFRRSRWRVPSRFSRTSPRNSGQSPSTVRSSALLLRSRAAEA